MVWCSQQKDLKDKTEDEKLKNWYKAVIDWKLMLTVAAIAIVGLFLGMNLSKKVSETALKKGFGYFVLIMGAFILFDQIKRM
jgi:uncharacterized membrane protein YfcA